MFLSIIIQILIFVFLNRKLLALCDTDFNMINDLTTLFLVFFPGVHVTNIEHVKEQ